jgi:hypothetical protein
MPGQRGAAPPPAEQRAGPHPPPPRAHRYPSSRRPTPIAPGSIHYHGNNMIAQSPRRGEAPSLRAVRLVQCPNRPWRPAPPPPPREVGGWGGDGPLLSHGLRSAMPSGGNEEEESPRARFSTCFYHCLYDTMIKSFVSIGL